MWVGTAGGFHSGNWYAGSSEVVGGSRMGMLLSPKAPAELLEGSRDIIVLALELVSASCSC